MLIALLRYVDHINIHSTFLATNYAISNLLCICHTSSIHILMSHFTTFFRPQCHVVSDL
jgi:hypothetical protein